MTGMKIFTAVLAANMLTVVACSIGVSFALEQAKTQAALDRANTVYVAPDPK